MKKMLKIYWLVFGVVLLVFTSCENSGDIGNPPELPPYESMAMDFDDFSNNKSLMAENKSDEIAANENWFYSALVVGFWNTTLFANLAVPVAAYKTAFAHTPVSLENNKWQWQYTVEGFTSQYTARLTAELTSEEVLWEMYIMKTGIEGFEEFLWFSGVSQLDARSGYWTLNHSANFPENMLRIDWLIENDEVGSIKYTYVRELNDNRETDTFKDSYIIYGLKDTDMDAFYNVHAFNNDISEYVDVAIEWSRTNYNGHVRSLSYFENDNWHCWDETGQDIDCE